MRGWLAAQEGDFDGGIEKMTYTIEQPFSASFRPIYLSQLVEQQIRAGHTEQAMIRVQRGIEEISSKGNRFCAPEFYRLRGEVLLAQAPGNAGDRALELRAASSLAQLLSKTGRAAEARDVLAPVYGAFTEGFERPDLKTAQALLAELG